jgi:DNA repair protein RadC
VADRAAAIIVAHNHPSGSAEPSKQDIATTQQLVAAGQILGIPLFDHVIVGSKGHFSFRKQGLLGYGDELIRGEGVDARTTN